MQVIYKKFIFCVLDPKRAQSGARERRRALGRVLHDLPERAGRGKQNQAPKARAAVWQVADCDDGRSPV